MMERNQRAAALLLITALMLACVPTLRQPPAPVATFDPNSINTLIVQTADAALTQTALFTTPSATPTASPTVTATPSETPTAVPTILILLPTATFPTAIQQVGTKDDKFACMILSKIPIDGYGFSAGIEFTVSWQVMNIGKQPWDSASADIHYLSGDKLNVNSGYDLEKDVAPNDQYTVTVKMKAPQESGTYTTVWVMGTKAAEYCRMSITITV